MNLSGCRKHKIYFAFRYVPNNVPICLPVLVADFLQLPNMFYESPNFCTYRLIATQLYWFLQKAGEFVGLVAVVAQHLAHRLEAAQHGLEGVLALLHRLSGPGVFD